MFLWLKVSPENNTIEISKIHSLKPAKIFKIFGATLRQALSLLFILVMDILLECEICQTLPADKRDCEKKRLYFQTKYYVLT